MEKHSPNEASVQFAPEHNACRGRITHQHKQQHKEHFPQSTRLQNRSPRFGLFENELREAAAR